MMNYYENTRSLSSEDLEDIDISSDEEYTEVDQYEVYSLLYDLQKELEDMEDAIKTLI
jgi:hypothetical protein